MLSRYTRRTHFVHTQTHTSGLSYRKNQNFNALQSLGQLPSGGFTSYTCICLCTSMWGRVSTHPPTRYRIHHVNRFLFLCLHIYFFITIRRIRWQKSSADRLSGFLPSQCASLFSIVMDQMGECAKTFLFILFGSISSLNSNSASIVIFMYIWCYMNYSRSKITVLLLSEVDQK